MFNRSSQTNLFHPTPIATSISVLSSIASKENIHLFSHPEPFFLNITNLHHKPLPSAPKRRQSQPQEIVTFPSYKQMSSAAPRRPFTLSNENSIEDGPIQAGNVASFYRTMIRHPTSHLQPTHAASHEPTESPPNPFMLLRTPPSWDFLITQLASNRAIVSRKKAKLSPDNDKHLADQVRRTQKTHHSLQAIRTMIGQRMSTTSHEGSNRPQQLLPVSSNPFVRAPPRYRLPDEKASKTQDSHGGWLEEDSIVDVQMESHRAPLKTSSTEKDVTSFDLTKAASTLISPVTSSTKPLRRISTLPVPELPHQLARRNRDVVTKPSSASASRRKSDTHLKQSTLLEFTKQNSERPRSRSPSTLR